MSIGELLYNCYCLYYIKNCQNDYVIGRFYEIDSNNIIYPNHHCTPSSLPQTSHVLPEWPLGSGAAWQKKERLTLSANDLHVEVGQATSDGQGQRDHAIHRHRVPVQVVKQRAVLVVFRHKPQLCPRAVI